LKLGSVCSEVRAWTRTAVLLPVIGYNYRLTNVACAILCAQLERLGDDCCGGSASSMVIGSAWKHFGHSASSRSRLGPVGAWMFCITVDARAFGASRDELGRGSGRRWHRNGVRSSTRSTRCRHTSRLEEATSPTTENVAASA